MCLPNFKAIRAFNITSYKPVLQHIYTLAYVPPSLWGHQLETFSALLAIFAGNSPVPGEFPAQRPETRSFDVFFDLRLKRLSKQSRGWWFETLSRPLWRHCNGWSEVYKDYRGQCSHNHHIAFQKSIIWAINTTHIQPFVKYFFLFIDIPVTTYEIK